MQKLSINQWPEEDRPREKMMSKGAESLTDAELMAILIGSGNRDESAVTLMQRILAASDGDLNQLGKWEVRDIYHLFHPLLCDLPYEEFWILLLNQASRIINKVRISIGCIDQTVADVRTILREALLQRATQLALVHNHPSGNPRPGPSDRQLTHHVQQGANLMNIRLIDHLVVTDESFYSFADEGLL
ncbi:MAG: hypothetical protein LBM06_04910 [Prevotellaceae bacterium]|jgi:DNA repair protein RadC|nr:hypothetical protein [Prevotellaceae bacterium]